MLSKLPLVVEQCLPHCRQHRDLGGGLRGLVRAQRWVREVRQLQARGQLPQGGLVVQRDALLEGLVANAWAGGVSDLIILYYYYFSRHRG